MAARCDEEVAKSVITKCIQKLGYLQLKPEQLKVITEFVNGRDVFAVLPTGYGKTLCYASRGCHVRSFCTTICDRDQNRSKS